MASTSDQFFYLDSPTQCEEWVDFDQFLDPSSAYGDEFSASASTNSVSPDMALSYDVEMLGMDQLDFTQSAFPDMTNYDGSQESFFLDMPPDMGMISNSNAPLDNSWLYSYPQYDASIDFRQLVEAQAAADPRIASLKEKRREAAIALHLQRLCETTPLDFDLSSDSNTSFSSPASSDYVHGSNSPQSASGSPETSSAPTPVAGNGGIELVLDLNMNAAANLPKKQKPRSQAQRENYIKARKYGACEKHKKQHKRCNCLEKAAVRSGVSDVPMNVAYKERPQAPAPQSPVRPGSRAYSVPGHERVVSPSMKLLVKAPAGEAPVRVTRDSPGFSPSTNINGVHPPVRTLIKRTSDVTGYNSQSSLSAISTSVKENGKNAALQSGLALTAQRTSSDVRRQATQYNASAFLNPVKEAGNAVPSSYHSVTRQTTTVTQPVKAPNHCSAARANLLGASTGFVPLKPHDQATGSSVRVNSVQSPQSAQSVKTRNQPTPVQPNLRWRIVGFSPTTDAGSFVDAREDRNTKWNTSTAAISKANVVPTGSPDLRFRNALSSSRVHPTLPSTASPVTTQNRSCSTPTTNSRKAGISGPLAVNKVSRPTACFQNPLDIFCPPAKTRVEASSQHCHTDSSKLQSGQALRPVRSLPTKVGGLLSNTLSSVAGIGFSPVSFTSWTEQSIGKCLSVFGKQLMFARKALQSSFI